MSAQPLSQCTILWGKGSRITMRVCGGGQPVSKCMGLRGTGSQCPVVQSGTVRPVTKPEQGLQRMGSQRTGAQGCKVGSCIFAQAGHSIIACNGRAFWTIECLVSKGDGNKGESIRVPACKAGCQKLAHLKTEHLLFSDVSCKEVALTGGNDT